MPGEMPSRPLRVGALRRHRIEFPPYLDDDVDQDEAFFYLVEDSERRKIRFHDYEEIYSQKGLYEQLFYDRLKCKSPQKVAEVLRTAVEKENEPPSELRVLDLGAGNGMAGEALAAFGVSRLVGVDIIEGARKATWRDRPGLYDEYYVADFCQVDRALRQEMESWQFSALVSVAALGFGDIPPLAVAEALGLVQQGGWIAFNIKHTFLDASDTSGFSQLVRALLFSDYLDLYHLERYRHRLSIHGTPLNYFALVARKSAETLPAEARAVVEASEESVAEPASVS